VVAPSVHLVSMPWSKPLSTPVQLGTLKSFLRQSNPSVLVKTYPAYFAIPFACAGKKSAECTAFSDDCESLDDWIYWLLYHKRFVLEDKRFGKKAVEAALAQIEGNGSTRRRLPDIRGGIQRIARLERATFRYLDKEIVPQLARNGVNLVGFSIVYHQSYASLLAARYLSLKHPGSNLMFVFGGIAATFPTTHAVFQDAGIQGLFCLGEGEVRLANIVSAIQQSPVQDIGSLLNSMHDPESRILSIQREAEIPPPIPSSERVPLNPKGIPHQIDSLGSLPPPDYEDYMEYVESVAKTAQDYAQMREVHIELLLEGSRGCFARCDFCSDNQHWTGFRTVKPAKVLQETLSLRDRYGVARVTYVDDLCDSWIGNFSRDLVDQEIKVPSFINLRAHHPEEYWTQLWLSGVWKCLVGIESLSDDLLVAMGKGTKVISNLKAMKYLSELGIVSISNIMTHHPKSTAEDIDKTERLIKQLPHFLSFPVSKFCLFYGSPIHLDMAKRHGGIEPLAKYPIGSEDFIITGEYHPGQNLNGELSARWDQFTAWYEKFRRQKRGTLLVVQNPDGWLKITDSRKPGKPAITWLNGDEARVYGLAHRGPNFNQLTIESGVPERRLADIVNKLCHQGVLLRLNDNVLAIALRERWELVQNYYRWRLQQQVKAKQANSQEQI